MRVQWAVLEVTEGKQVHLFVSSAEKVVFIEFITDGSNYFYHYHGTVHFPSDSQNSGRVELAGAENLLFGHRKKFNKILSFAVCGYREHMHGGKCTKNAEKTY